MKTDKEIIEEMEKFMKPPYWNPIIKECFYSVLFEQREELVKEIEANDFHWINEGKIIFVNRDDVIKTIQNE